MNSAMFEWPHDHDGFGDDRGHVFMSRKLCQPCRMNEVINLSQALQQNDRPGLLAEYGISLEGTPEALAELLRLLVDKPIGQAMLLIAEQGRHYGIRMYTTSQFDEELFLKDAARFGMDGDQAVLFALNLTPQAGATPKLIADIRPPRLHHSVVQKRPPQH